MLTHAVYLLLANDRSYWSSPQSIMGSVTNNVSDQSDGYVDTNSLPMLPIKVTTTVRSSSEAFSFSPSGGGGSLNHVYIFRWCVLFILVLLAVVGNGLTLWAIYTTEKLRTKTYVLVTSLAVADVLVGFCNGNFLVHDFWSLQACTMATYKSIVRPVIRFAAYVSYLHVPAIAFDRYVAIMHPLHYESRMTSATYRKLILSIWSAAGAIALPPYVSLFGVTPPDVGQSPTPCVKTLWPVVEGYLEVTIYLFNSSTILFVYVRIWLTAMHHGKFQTELNLRQQQKQKQVLSSVAGGTNRDVTHQPSVDAAAAHAERGQSLTITHQAASRWQLYQKVVRHRSTRTIMAVLVFFLVAWSPYTLARVLFIAGWPPALTMWLYSGIFGLSNMSMNVFVYAIMHRDFRAAFKRILRIGVGDVHIGSSTT